MEPAIYTTYYHSPVGIIEIKGTDAHIVSLLFLEEAGMGDPAPPTLFQACVEQFEEYFAGVRQAFTIPLAQAGTPFQQRVWQALTHIPFGKTVAYREIALQVADAKSIRAVGAANGQNKLNIMVPCHRVIGSNGKLVGYGGGLWRKQWLLAHEAKYGRGILPLF